MVEPSICTWQYWIYLFLICEKRPINEYYELFHHYSDWEYLDDKYLTYFLYRTKLTLVTEGESSFLKGIGM